MPVRMAVLGAFGLLAALASAIAAELEIVHALEADSCADLERLSLLQTRAGSLRSKPTDAADDDRLRAAEAGLAEAWPAVDDRLADLVLSQALGGTAEPLGSGAYPLGSSAHIPDMAALPPARSSPGPVVRMMTETGEVEIPIVTVNRTNRSARRHGAQRRIGMLSTQHIADEAGRADNSAGISADTPPPPAVSADGTDTPLANESSNIGLEAALQRDMLNNLGDAQAQLLRKTALGIDAQLQRLARSPAAPPSGSTHKSPSPAEANSKGQAVAGEDQSRNRSAVGVGEISADLLSRAPSSSADADTRGAKLSAEELLRVAREITEELHRTAEAEHHRRHHTRRGHSHATNKLQSSRRVVVEGATTAVVNVTDEPRDPLCARSRALNFQRSGVAASNLGGAGPDDGYPWLVFTNVTSVNGSQIDLEVVANSSYMPFDNTKNGLNGPFGVINLRVNSKVDLKFSFVNHSTGLPVVLEPFYLTFFDFDQGLAHGARETATVSGSEAFMLSDDTEVEVEGQTEDGTVVFASSMRGGKLDNPVFPGTLTHLQEDRSVTLLFRDTSSFSVTLEELGYPDSAQGRNFLFSGPSDLACPREHRCVEYHCPNGYHIRTMAEFLLCDGETCGEHDLDTCCYEALAAGNASDATSDESVDA